MVSKSVPATLPLTNILKSTLAFAFLFSAVLSSNAMAAENLFANPSFAQSLWGWNTNVVNPHEDSIRWVNDGGDGMTSAARFYTDGKENPAWHMQLAQSKAVVAGDLYKLSFGVATTSQYERDVTLYMQEDGGKWAILAEQPCTLIGEGITRCELLGTVPNNGKVNFGIKGADNLWDFTVDNAELNRLDNRRVDSLHFPDPSLAAAVAEKQATYVYQITELECHGYFGCTIRDTTGIEELTALKSLQIWESEFPDIDVSRMDDLETLTIWSSQLQSLDVSKNKSLQQLTLAAPISSMDLSNNPDLALLYLQRSGVSRLNLTQNSKLENISFGLIDCDSLHAIQKQFPNIETLSDARCFPPEQKKPFVAELPFNDFWLRECVLAMDVDYVEELTKLDCELDNEGRNDIHDFTGIEQLTELTQLWLDAFSATQIDVSKNLKLTSLSLNRMRISSLDLSANSELKNLSFKAGFEGEELDLSNNTNLIGLTIWGDTIKRLILPEQSSLGYIGFIEAQVDSVDLTTQPNLEYVDISESIVTPLDLSRSYKLKELFIGGEHYSGRKISLENFDLSNNPELDYLYVVDVELPKLDLSGNPKLTKLLLINNNLQSIDLSNNKALTDVRIENNPCLTIRSARHQLDPSINFIVEQKCSPQNIPVSDIRFPDAVLQDCFNRSVIVGQWKTLADVQSLSCERPNNTPIAPPKINSAAGIEQLTELRTLNLNGHSLDHIDLKSNVLLSSLSLRGNELSELNLSSLVNLTELDLRDNPLTLESIESIKRLPALSSFEHPPLVRDIYFPDPLLTQCVRDTGKAMVHELTELRCYRDVQDTRGIEHLKALIELNLHYGSFTTINLQSNMALKALALDSDQLTELNLPLNAVLETLRISRAKLRQLSLGDYSHLKNLNLSLIPIERVVLYKHKSLESLSLHGIPLSVFDTDSLKMQKSLQIFNYDLIDIDLSVLPRLENLSIEGSNLLKLDLSSNPELRFFTLGHSPIASIDFSNNPALTVLGFDNVPIEELDLSSNSAVLSLELGGNLLTELDLSANKALTRLALDSGNLVSLNITENTALTSLNLISYPFSTIDLTPYPVLEMLSLSGSPLESLNLSSNTILGELFLADTLLTELDLSGVQTLKRLYLQANSQLTSLDILDNQLDWIYIENSEFTCADIEMLKSKVRPLFGFNYDGLCVGAPTN